MPGVAGVKAEGQQTVPSLQGAQCSVLMSSRPDLQVLRSSGSLGAWGAEAPQLLACSEGPDRPEPEERQGLWGPGVGSSSSVPVGSEQTREPVRGRTGGELVFAWRLKGYPRASTGKWQGVFLHSPSHPTAEETWFTSHLAGTLCGPVGGGVSYS